MRPTLKYAVLAAAGLAVLYLGVSWIIDALRSDESRVRLVFENVQRYAREVDAGGVLEYLDPKYRDPQGFTAPEVRRLVHGYFMSCKSVEAELEPVGIEGLRVDGDEVDVLVRARVVIRMPGGEALTFDDAAQSGPRRRPHHAAMKGDHFVVRLRRHGSYFRARSVRPARPEEVPER